MVFSPSTPSHHVAGLSDDGGAEESSKTPSGTSTPRSTRSVGSSQSSSAGSTFFPFTGLWDAEVKELAMAAGVDADGHLADPSAFAQTDRETLAWLRENHPDIFTNPGNKDDRADSQQQNSTKTATNINTLGTQVIWTFSPLRLSTNSHQPVSLRRSRR